MSLDKIITNGTNQVVGSLQKPIQQAVQQVTDAISTPKCLEGLNALGFYNKSLVKQGGISADIPTDVSSGIMSVETFERAKSMVMQTILRDKPKESLVLVQGDKIVPNSFCVGEYASIKLNNNILALLDSAKEKIIAIHSHSDLSKNIGSTPLSIEDFFVLNFNNSLRSIYAINNKGEYSLLRQNGEKLSEKEFEALGEHYLKMMDKVYMMAGALPEQKRYKALLNQAGQLIIDGKDVPQFLVKELDAVAQLLQEKTDGLDIINHHKFWQKYAPEAHVIYETNFSNLKG